MCQRRKISSSVVRCWDRTEEELKDFLDNIQEMKAQLPELKGLLAVINTVADPNSKTKSSIETTMQTEELDFAVVPVDIVDNYSWTAGLNAPAALMYQGLRRENKPPENVSMFNISFDVRFDPQDLQNLLNQYRKLGFAITARKGSKNIPLPRANEVAELLRLPFEPAKKYLLGALSNQNIVALARNTATIVPLSEIARLQGYNNACNESGGMEDHEFIVRVILDFLRKGKFGIVKEILRACNNPAYYQDARWDNLTDEAKDKKISRELDAIITIAKNMELRSEETPENNKYVTPEQNRDFNFS